MAVQSLNVPYIVLSGAIALAVVTAFTAYRPLLRDINQAQAEMALQQATVREKQDFLSTLDRKKSFLGTQADAEKKLAAMLPDNEQTEDVLRILQVTVNESGGILNTVKNISETVTGQMDARRARGDSGVLPADVDPLGVSLQFKGSYQQMRAFLGKITVSPRLMDVQNITLRRENDQADIVTADMTIHFYQENPAALRP